MPTRTEFPQGAPVWADLQSTDRDDAVRFYSDLFGWQIMQPHEAAGMFALASTAEAPVAAIGPLAPDLVDQGARSSWTLYLAVDDLDAVVETVEQAGGRVVLPPGRLGGGVRLALVADPAGAIVGLWEGGQEAGWAYRVTGAADWFELVGPEAEAALDFYVTTLGMTVSTMSMGETEYRMLAVDGVERAGSDPSDTSDGTAWRIYFRVDDIDEACRRVRESGGTLLSDVARFEQVGAWAAARDPQGAVFSMLQPPVPAEGDDATADQRQNQEGTAHDE